MKFKLSRRNPVAVLLCWLCGLAVLAVGRSLAQSLVLLGFIAVTSVFFMPAKRLLWVAVITLPIVIITPIFNHTGRTVWFFVGYTPITVEAVQLGIQFAASMATLSLWLMLLIAWVDTSSLLMMLRRVAPRLALTLQMTLRALPLMRRRAALLRQTIKLRGNNQSRLRQSVLALSAWTTWNLESGMDMAVQLRVRGFGAKKVTTYRRTSWRWYDFALILVAITIGTCLCVI